MRGSYKILPLSWERAGSFENALHDSDLFNGARCAPYMAAGTSEDL